MAPPTIAPPSPAERCDEGSCDRAGPVIEGRGSTSSYRSREGSTTSTLRTARMEVRSLQWKFAMEVRSLQCKFAMEVCNRSLLLCCSGSSSSRA